jgi:hypothetical protein
MRFSDVGSKVRRSFRGLNSVEPSKSAGTYVIVVGASACAGNQKTSGQGVKADPGDSELQP